MQKHIKILLLLVNLSIGVSYSQVTIGLTEEPQEGQILQIKDIENITDGSANAYKGFALPRVSLSKKYELYPMYLSDPADSTSVSTSEYISDKATIKQSHTGLIVYNVTQVDDQDLSIGLNQWDGVKWTSFESPKFYAVLEDLDCSDISIEGIYTKDNPLTSDNYITLTLSVEEAGYYDIVVSSGNGYTFHGRGEILEKGESTITLPGIGTPINKQTDNLSFSGINVTSGCTKQIEVYSSLANFSLLCDKTSVTGTYAKGDVLDSSHTIKVSITVNEIGSYWIRTQKTNGVEFSAIGEITSKGVQTITLIGSGTPTVVTDFDIVILSSSSEGLNECSATIPVILPQLSVKIIGNQQYSWSSYRKLAIESSTNFGPSGTLKMKGPFIVDTYSNDFTSAVDEIIEDLAGTPPDIILISGYGSSNTGSATFWDVISRYINKGGCVFMFTNDNVEEAAVALLKGVFDVTAVNAGTVTSSKSVTLDDNYEINVFSFYDYPYGRNNYAINAIPNDPIIDGPFGNIAGSYWSEDNSGTVFLSSLPEGAVQICNAIPQNYFVNNGPVDEDDPDKINPAKLQSTFSTVWYHDEKNFVYIGDSTYASIYYSTDSSSTPSAYNAGTYTPYRYKQGGAYYGANGYNSTVKYIDNSTLEMNGVAWLAKKAATSGINTY